MKSKKLQSPKQKNSNLKTQSQVEKPEKKFVITPDSSLVLTIQESGRFKSHSSNAATKEEIRKMRRSWMLKEDKTGKFTRRSIDFPWVRLLPGEHVRNYYVNYREYAEPQMYECCRKIVMQSEALHYYISDEARPYFIKQEVWENMSKKARLETNLNITAEGKPYYYEILN